MNVLDFQDRTAPIPMPSDAQLRRLAPNLNHVTSYAALLLLSDRATPFLAKQPIWRDCESLRLLRLVEKHLIPEVVRRLVRSNIPQPADLSFISLATAMLPSRSSRVSAAPE